MMGDTTGGFTKFAQITPQQIKDKSDMKSYPIYKFAEWTLKQLVDYATFRYEQFSYQISSGFPNIDIPGYFTFQVIVTEEGYVVSVMDVSVTGVPIYRFRNHNLFINGIPWNYHFGIPYQMLKNNTVYINGTPCSWYGAILRLNPYVKEERLLYETR